nr:zinc finger protein 16-like [Aedes albopictus]
MMDPTNGSTLEVPHSDPTAYCRLCLTLTSYRVLTSSQSELVPVIWKQLRVQLDELEGDFPCAVCAVCVEKLEELAESNRDGLLEEWHDAGLLEYRESCQSVDTVVRSSRLVEGNPGDNNLEAGETVVLPFQRLNDGRYRCNECPHVVFDEISACIGHYHENHQNTSVTQFSVEKFSCSQCTDEFGTAEELSAHQKTHLAPKPRKRVYEEATSSSTPPSMVNGNGNKMPSLKCINCTEIFEDVDELISHRVTAHALVLSKKTVLPKSKPITRKNFIISPASTTCKACQIKYADKRALYMHINTVHAQNLCYVCDRSFPSASKLVKHQSFHRNLSEIVNPFLQGKHSYHCKVCFEKFRTEADIRLHFETKHANDSGTEHSPIAFGNGTIGNAPSSLSLASGLRITCTQCLTAFSSEALLERHQQQECGVTYTMAQSDVVEID